MRPVIIGDDGMHYSPGPHASDYVYRDAPSHLTDEDIRYSMSLSDEDRLFLTEEQAMFILMAHQDKVEEARKSLQNAQ